MTRRSPQAKAVAARCADAHSAPAYRSWVAVAQALLDAGYKPAQAEGIMRSKWTRWARDHFGPDSGAPAHIVLRYIAHLTARQGRRAVLAEIDQFVLALPNLED